MDDNFNTGSTIYRDKDGNKITEQEYNSLQNSANEGDKKEEMTDAD